MGKSGSDCKTCVFALLLCFAICCCVDRWPLQVPLLLHSHVCGPQQTAAGPGHHIYGTPGIQCAKDSLACLHRQRGSSAIHFSTVDGNVVTCGTVRPVLGGAAFCDERWWRMMLDVMTCGTVWPVMDGAVFCDERWWRVMRDVMTCGTVLPVMDGAVFCDERWWRVMRDVMTCGTVLPVMDGAVFCDERWWRVMRDVMTCGTVRPVMDGAVFCDERWWRVMRDVVTGGTVRPVLDGAAFCDERWWKVMQPTPQTWCSALPVCIDNYRHVAFLDRMSLRTLTESAPILFQASQLHTGFQS